MSPACNQKQTLLQGWLSHTPATFHDRLLEQCARVEISQGNIIFTVGENSSGLWGMAKGQVHFNIATHEHGPRFGHVLGPGAWFGDYELITGNPRILEVKASRDCVLYHLPSQKFQQLAKEYPLSWRWIALLATQHTALALGAADDLMIKKSDARLAALLLRLSGRRGAPEGTIPLDDLDVTQQNLSDALNLSRTATGQKLRKLRDRKMIGFTYTKLKILDPQALMVCITE
jgi:CRP-like cAMP-binding protein